MISREMKRIVKTLHSSRMPALRGALLLCAALFIVACAGVYSWLLTVSGAAQAAASRASAATSDPKCSGPVGEGAKRPMYSTSVSGKCGDRAAL